MGVYNNIDIYDMLGISKDSSLEKVELRMKKLEELLRRNPTEESLRIFSKIEEEYQKIRKEKLKKDDVYSDNTFMNMVNKNHAEKRKTYRLQPSDNKPKQAKSVKIKAKVIKVIAGAMVGVCAFGVIKAGMNNLKKINNENNVCVEYIVQQGDTKERLSGLFKEYGVSYLEVSGTYRDTDYIYASDVVIGRTTKEKADDLVAKGLARIISIDEAVELLGENNALIGEFRAYANGNSDMVFFVPEQKTMA